MPLVINCNCSRRANHRSLPGLSVEEIIDPDDLSECCCLNGVVVDLFARFFRVADLIVGLSMLFCLIFCCQLQLLFVRSLFLYCRRARLGVVVARNPLSTVFFTTL